ncbi:MAG TPA: IMP cyclohydrolase [Gaiellaceae bacterium]|jgi:IMP cyclohydrolase
MAVEGFPIDRYSGRGLIVGRSTDGKSWLQIYWLSGRSENSRNRVLIDEEGEIRTATADRSKQVDGTFTLYTALCSVEGAQIVGNGDQVTTVAEALATGGSFEQALRTREVENDPPIWTPRITAMVKGDDLRFSKISKNGHGFFEAKPLEPGNGLCMHTYRGDGDPIRRYHGDPYRVRLDGSPEELAKSSWEKLDSILRVALVVKEISEDGSFRHVIVNRLKPPSK